MPRTPKEQKRLLEDVMRLEKSFAFRFLAVLFVVVSLPLMAQSTGGITGVVVDETGAAIEGARISILDGNGATRATALTKRDGSFVIQGLAPGRYRVTAESKQFETGQAAIEMTEATTMPTVSLKLRVRAVTQEVTVTAATRSETKIEDLPVSASIVTREAVRDSAAQSLDELLLTIPGVNLQEPPSFAQP